MLTTKRTVPLSVTADGLAGTPKIYRIFTHHFLLGHNSNFLLSIRHFPLKISLFKYKEWVNTKKNRSSRTGPQLSLFSILAWRIPWTEESGGL